MIKGLIKRLLAVMGYEVYRRPADVQRAAVDELCEKCSLPRIPSLSIAQYEQECPPLADPALTVPAEVPLRHYHALSDALHSDSMKQYFHVQSEGGSFTVTDRYEGSHYSSRQRMLHAVYRRFFGANLGGSTVLDIGCSSGYYSFLCARAGASAVLGVDARPEHEDQFDILHKTLGMPASCSYRHLDMELDLEALEGPYDLVLAQGVLYHVYDHPRFLKNLHRLTRGVLVLEGHCSGHSDLLCRAAMEPVDSLRASIHGPVIYPSAPWMVELVRWAGFSEVYYVDFPSDVEGDWGYDQLRRCMLVAVKTGGLSRK